MSTLRKAKPPPQDDPFFYGFRYASRTLPDGREEVEEVPLTEEDVLHPQEGDHISSNDPHTIDVRYLGGVFTALVAAVPGAVVLSDTLIAWHVGRIRPMSPDIAVIFGVAQRQPWSSFDVAAAGVGPELVVEVTSPSTRNADLNRKLDLYYRVGVPLYAIVDQESMRGGRRRLRILGYRRGKRGYVRLRLNRQRRLWLQSVNCWLAVEQGQVVCYDAQGQRIDDFAAQMQKRAAAEARVRQLEEELRRLRGEE